MFRTMLIFKTDTPARQMAIYSLALVGFMALVALGIALAVYSSRFAPNVMSRLGAAAVSLSELFRSAEHSSLSVIPTASTTISFGGATTTKLSTSTPMKMPVSKTPGTKSNTTYQISGATSTPALSGLPDFIVTINGVGYLATSSAESFIASSTVPTGSRPAVKFTIKNVGTNATGQWRFSASIPTQSAYIYQSQLQQSLNPGDSIEYTLGFDQPAGGSNQTISITANFDTTVAESNTLNNSASTKVTILGS